MAHLRSNNITLQFYDDVFGRHHALNELWQMFRKTAVEPGQSSSPDFASFADECLLCAQIMRNDAAFSEDENNESLWDDGQTLQDAPPSSATLTATLPPTGLVGLVYLHAGPATIAGGEANIGVITASSMQRRGYAREAIQLVLRWAFEELKFHRVQAAVLDTPFRDSALRLFIGSGFTHEGTKRRAVYQPEGEGMVGLWKDVTYLAMLDTEWALRSTWVRDNHPPPSLWDEMFARHAREREELVRWEEKHGRVRRTSSMETLRERSNNAQQDMAYLTDDASSLSSSAPPSPRLGVVMTWENDTHMADDLGPDGSRQRWEEVVETSLAARRHRQWIASSSMYPSLQPNMLALPSIPSIGVSEGNLQSPLTIPSPSSRAGSIPPLSSSPSAASSPAHSAWSDSDSDSEEHWRLPGTVDATPTNPFTTPYHPYAFSRAGSASPETRSRSVSVFSSSSSSDSWSDAQSSVGSSSSDWDVISNASDHLSDPNHAHVE